MRIKTRQKAGYSVELRDKLRPTSDTKLWICLENRSFKKRHAHTHCSGFIMNFAGGLAANWSSKPCNYTLEWGWWRLRLPARRKHVMVEWKALLDLACHALFFLHTHTPTEKRRHPFDHLLLHTPMESADESSGSSSSSDGSASPWWAKWLPCGTQSKVSRPVALGAMLLSVRMWHLPVSPGFWKSLG